MKRFLLLITLLAALLLPSAAYAVPAVVGQGGTATSSFGTGGLIFSPGGTNYLYAISTSTLFANLATGTNYWSANGSNIYYNGSGNVGVGTSSPTAKLQVGDSIFIGRPDLPNTIIVNNSGLNYAAYVLQSSEFATDPFTATGYIELNLDEFDDWGFGTKRAVFNTDMPIIFSDNNGTQSTASVINSITGRVGISTTTPATTLDVDGTTRSTLFHARPGSVSAPSYSFVGDGNTGFYNVTTGMIGIVSGGSSIGTFSASGLNIADINVTNLTADVTNTSTLDVTASTILNSSAEDYDTIIRSNNNNNMLFVDGGTDRVGIGTGTPLARLHVTGVGGTKPFRISSSTNTSLVEVLQNGYVGIGTTNPGKILTINDIGGLATFRVERTGQVNNLQTDFAIQTPGGVQHFQIDVTDGASTPKVLSLNPSQGNVGIWTISPLYQLSLGSNVANTKLAIYDDGTSSMGIGAQSGVFRFNLYNGGTQRYGFYAGNNTELMSVLNTGRVGIGTTSPVAMLNVQGTSSAATVPVFDVASSTGTYQSGNPSGSLFRVNSSGNVGIGTTTTPAALTIERNNAGSTYLALLLKNTSTFIFHGGLSFWVSSDGSGGSFNYAATPNFDANGIISSITCEHGGRGCVTMESVSGELRIHQRIPAGGYLGFPIVMNSGMVGIGTTSANASLSVKGTSTNPTRILLDVASSTGASFFRVLPTGLVGVGTTTPASVFNVAGSGLNNIFRLSSSTGMNLFSVDYDGRPTRAASSSGEVVLASGAATVGGLRITAKSRVHLTLQNCSTCGTVYLNGTTTTSITIGSTNILDASTVFWTIEEIQ